MKANMEKHPEELGFLFQINDNDNDNGSNDTATTSKETDFDCAVTKFVIKKYL